jgi:predicted Fe-Mo cluster-binding NifX family protein
MNICIPIEEDRGLRSKVSRHFGSAPKFLIVDTGTSEYRTIENRNHGREHHHGQCRPLDSIRGEDINSILVGGIGGGAFRQLQQAGIQALLSEHQTVEEAIAAYAAGDLKPVDPSSVCRQHRHGEHASGSGGGCSHRTDHDHDSGAGERAPR